MRLIDAVTLKAEFTGNFKDEYTRAEVHALIDLAPTVGGWISVKDRLPNRDGLYVVYGQTEAMRELLPDNDPIWMCYYRKERGFYDTELCRGYDFITHWMPLPEPPKEEKAQ